MLIKKIKDREILLQEEMLIKDFLKDREILLQEEMLIKDFFKDGEILLQEEMLIKRFFFSRTGKSCFKKRC